MRSPCFAWCAMRSARSASRARCARSCRAQKSRAATLLVLRLLNETPDGAGAGDAPSLGELVELFGDVWREPEKDLDGVSLRIGDVLSGLLFLLGGHGPIVTRWSCERQAPAAGAGPADEPRA